MPDSPRCSFVQPLSDKPCQFDEDKIIPTETGAYCSWHLPGGYKQTWSRAHRDKFMDQFYALVSAYENTAAPAQLAGVVLPECDLSGRRLVRADFRCAEFLSPAHFQKTIFLHAVRFDFARFQTTAHFDDAEFHDDVSFDHARFHGDAYFSQCEQNSMHDAHIESLAPTYSWRSAHFAARACFRGRIFYGPMHLTDGRFSRAPEFKACNFLSEPVFPQLENFLEHGTEQANAAYRELAQFAVRYKWPQEYRRMFRKLMGESVRSQEPGSSFKQSFAHTVLARWSRIKAHLFGR